MLRFVCLLWLSLRPADSVSTMKKEGVEAASPGVFKSILLVYHAGDTSIERITVYTPAPLEVGDTASMKRALASLDVRDVLKVKIDDGTFFGGRDLVDSLCSRLKEEVAFGATVRKELEEERLAASNAFDWLSEAEKSLKKRLRELEAKLELTERRFSDTTEANRLHKELRMKEMFRQQAATKEIASLQAEVSSLMDRVNLQATVSAAMGKECEALRSTLRAGQRVREMDDTELRRTLSEKLEREENMIRLKRRLHAAEADKEQWRLRLTRSQHTADRLRAIIWSNGINPAAKVGNASSAASARVSAKTARRRQQKRLSPLRYPAATRISSSHDPAFCANRRQPS